MTEQPTLGAFIRERRVELGLTQEQLAKRIGVKQAEVSRLEADHIEVPRQPRLENIASALGVTIGSLHACIYQAKGVQIAADPPPSQAASSLPVPGQHDVPDPDDDALTALERQVHDISLRITAIQDELQFVLEGLQTLQRDRGTNTKRSTRA